MLWRPTGLSCFVLIATGLLAWGHEDHDEPPRVPDEVAFGATGLPDRIVLTWDDDPTSSQAVTWRTDASVQRGLAEIAVAEEGPYFFTKATRVEAETRALPSKLGSTEFSAHYHTASFTGLEPATRYAYRVGDGTNWSEWNQFTTAAREAKPFSFVYFGDAQNEVKSLWSRVVREAYRDAPHAAFFLHAGDLVNRAHSDREWGEWHAAGSHIHRMTPCLATPGNHEYRDGKLSSHWTPGFAFPQHGPPGLDETVYWVDYQGVRIISLNSNTRLREQAIWVETVLTDNPNRWTVISYHHPMFSPAKNRDNARLRELWQPIFDQYGVDLVLQGHDHTYARTGLIKKTENLATGGSQRSQGGTLYVVSVSGPKMYNVDRKPFMRRVAEDTQLYQIIRVEEDQLHYEARTAIGTLYDGFTIRKREGEPNELIDRIPDTPERRRGY